MTRINVSLLKSYKSNFDNAKSNFKATSYSTFLSSYINSCSDSTVIRMKNKLKSLYDAIEQGYNSIDNWWSSYNGDIENLENVLSNDGRSGAINESSIRNYVNSNLPELTDYDVPFSGTFNLNFDNTSSSFTLNNFLNALNMTTTYTTTGTINANSSTSKWWNDNSLSYTAQTIFNNDVNTNTSNSFESVNNDKKDFINWLKNDALPFMNTCYNNYQEVTNMVNSNSCLTGATSAVALLSFTEGIAKFGEKLVDFSLVAGTGANVEQAINQDNFTFIYSTLVEGETKYGTNLANKQKEWEYTQSFVANNYVNSWYDNFYENNEIGKYIKENSIGFDTVRAVSSGFGEVGANVGLSLLTLGGSSAAGLATNMTNVMTTNAFMAGFGNGAENAWANGATLQEGLTTAAINGSWEAFQWWAGAKIGNWNPFKGNTTSVKLANSLLRIGADTLDSGVEGFVQPGISMIYQDGYYDTDGNYKEFTDDDNIWEKYIELFDDAGGWNNVGTQALIGMGGSLIGELGEFNKLLQNPVDTPKVDVVTEVKFDPEHGYQLSIDDMDDFYKTRLQSGWFTQSQMDNILQNINTKGYLDANIAVYLKSLFEDDYDIYVKTVNSADLDSINAKGIYCNGTATSIGGGVPQTIKDINIENTITPVNCLYDVVRTMKSANGLSQGGNPIDGTIIIKVPKGISMDDLVYHNGDVFCIKPEYIDGYSGVDAGGNIGNYVLKNGETIGGSISASSTIKSGIDTVNSRANLESQIARVNELMTKGDVGFHTINVDSIDDIPVDFYSRFNNPEKVILKVGDSIYDYSQFLELNDNDITALLASATYADTTNYWSKEALETHLHNLFDQFYGYDVIQHNVLDQIQIIDAKNWKQVLNQRGLSDNICGFVDSNGVMYLPSDANMHTAIHEAFHKVSELSGTKAYDATGNIRKITGIREFYNDGFNSTWANETLTEYLSSKYGDGKIYGSMYGEANVVLWNRIDEAISKVDNRDLLFWAYFNNDTSYIREFFNNYGGGYSYDDFARKLQYWYSSQKDLNDIVTTLEKNVYKEHHPLLYIIKSIFGGNWHDI